jgi:LuxR family transcriptional regulator, maltose regulon positive regulatory protein
VSEDESKGVSAESTFGQRLRVFREHAGLSQEELAERAGLTPNAVGALERGVRRRPYPHTVRALATALALSEAERSALLATIPRRGTGAPAPASGPANFPDSGKVDTTPARSAVPPALPLIKLPLTKLFVPPLPATLVRRPRLVARLGESLQRPLTLISAPPGWGKTSLIAEWHAGQEHASLAWLSLDEGESDPVRFWTAVVAALQTVQPNTGEDALALLRSPQPPAIPSIVAALLNDLVGLPEQTVLVLDDYHVIQSAPVHESLALFVDRQPLPLRLVVTTRADPLLPLARWRARGHLAEVRAADLRFSPDEASTFLTGVMGLPLDASAVTALEARTEGWIAGLHLAALALRDRADLDSFVAAFSGSHRFVADYLAEEVLRRQPEAVQAFLLRTSVLERLCAELCDALVDDRRPTTDDRATLEYGQVGLTGGGSDLPGRTAPDEPERMLPLSPSSSVVRSSSDSEAVLHYLDRANLFLVALDEERRWYRYHHLFADLLRARLRRTEPDRVPDLYRRASHWSESQGLVDEALRYALASGEVDRAAGIVETHARPAIFRGDHAAARGWLAALPEEAIASRPALALSHAQTLIFAGNVNAAEARVRMAEAALPGQEQLAGEAPAELHGTALAIRGYLSIFRGEFDQAIHFLDQGRERLAQDSPLQAYAQVALGHAHLGRGEVRVAAQAYSAAVTLGRQTNLSLGLSLAALQGVAACLFFDGRLHEAAARCREGLALAESQGAGRVLIAGDLHRILSALAHEWNALQTAERHAQQAAEIGKRNEYPTLSIAADIALARVHAARGDAEQSRAAIARAEERARHLQTPLALASVGTARVQTELALSRPPGPVSPVAMHWAQTCGLGVDDDLTRFRGFEHVVLARVLVRQPDQRTRGLGLLARLREDANKRGSAGQLIAVRAAEAAAIAGDDPAQGLTALTQALELAQPEGYVRTFLDEGAALIPLLRRLAKGSHEYAAQLLAQVDAEAQTRQGTAIAPVANRLSAHPGLPGLPDRLDRLDRPKRLEPLTARERDVLQLVAEGASNREIAERLTITLGTVKKYVSVISAKLGSSNRTQAAARARAAGLVDR